MADPDGDPLTVTLQGKPFWLNHTPGTNGGTITGIPGAEQEVIMKLSVSDGSKTTVQEIILVVTDGSGIEGVNGDRLTVYPNPVVSTLCDKVVVTDISGKQLLFAEQVESVDVSMLSSGIYFVTMQLGDRVNTTQVIKR